MDEAERCHRLLLMRDGRILAEDTPDALRHRTGTATVEEAFLHLVDADRADEHRADADRTGDHATDEHPADETAAPLTTEEAPR